MPATESKPTAAAVKAEAVAAKAEAPAPVLGDAGASSDAAVQNLLAQLEIHERNDDKDAAKAVKARLVELGVTV